MIDATTIDEPRVCDTRHRTYADLFGIMRCVCRLCLVGVDEVIGRGVHADIVLAREAYVLMARQYTACSYPEIARSMGRRSHSTIVHQHRRAMQDQQARAVAARAAQIMGWTTQ